jgi:aminoglycoside 2''-phosphotransferase
MPEQVDAQDPQEENRETTRRYLERIRRYFPDLRVDQVQSNDDGLMNDVLIVNQERIFRLAKDQQWIRDCLQQEARILSLVRQYVTMPVPAFDVHDVDCVSYRLLPGQGLSRHDLLCQPESAQDALADQLAIFMRELHSIPQEALEQHAIPATNASQTREEYLEFLEDLEREVLPLASSQVCRILRQHFEPLLQGWLDLSHTPALIHGDLGQRHILFDPGLGCITGVLDFGVAGIGDPAHDFGVLLNCYGESFVRRMAQFTPEIEELIDRARFMSGIAEPSWVLRGLRSKDPLWFTLSLATARDIQPIGTRWA